MPVAPEAGTHTQHRSRRDPLGALIDLADKTITVADLVRGQLLYRVAPDGQADRIAVHLERLGLDVAPLDEIPITRYVDRSWLRLHDGTPVEVARAIDPSILVAANLPLSEVIGVLRDSAVLFIFDRHEITAILTRADLQAPAVALYALGMITAAEAALDELIARYSNNDWAPLLPGERMAKVREVFAVRQAHNTEIDLIHCLNLDDRLTLVEKLDGLSADLGFKSGRMFCAWTRPVKRLRDTLAHGDSLLAAQPDPIAAIDLLTAIRTFAETSWKLVHDRESLFDRFAATTITATLDDRGIELAGPSAVDWPFDAAAAWVITACNPMGRPQPASQNDQADVALRADLISSGHTPIRSAGRTGSWHEKGFLLLGADEEIVLRLARFYAQSSVFQLTADTIEVISTDGRRQAMQPRRQTASASGPPTLR